MNVMKTAVKLRGPALRPMAMAGVVRPRMTNLSLILRFQSTTMNTSNMSTTTTAKPLKFKKSTLSPVSDFTATKVQNQQISDYNNLPLQLALTESAANKLSKLSKEENNPKLALRLVVSSGGCHGFQYDLEIKDTDDFKPDDGDTLFERDGGRVMVDKEALEIMRDSKIDYVKELIGEGFKIIESPLTKSSCGCGSSFDVDFEKLENLGKQQDDENKQ